MDLDQQLQLRIRAFVNASDLTDSPTARELYQAYREMNNTAVRRLLECEVLVQKKQKIEAVLLAQHEPKLFDLVDFLLFPERAVLVELADLYEWPALDELNAEKVELVRGAVAAMDDLRPLLTEFRRIARTDLVEDKLHLLREIYRLDNGNPEWRLPLTEVENQYLSRLIAEAQESIRKQDFGRLKEIHSELHRTPWLVTIPSIVLQKIDKIVAAKQLEQDREQAMKLLDRIATAYGAFDIVALEDAILCWNEHCKTRNYQPNENERLQFDEANEYLNSEKAKIKSRQDFQRKLEQTSALIDEGAPLEEVERCFAEAEAFGREVPENISNRVMQYRIDVERERRTAAVLKVCRIAGVAAVAIVALVGGGILTAQYLIEKQQSSNLFDALSAGDAKKARSLLSDIEKKYPRLAGRPRISRARAEVAKLEEQEARRIEEFKATVAELEKLLNAPEPDELIRTKLAAAKKLARDKLERQQLQELAAAAEEKFSRFAEESEDRFLRLTAALKELNQNALEAIEAGKKNGDFGAAKALVDKAAALCSEIRGIPGVKESLRADNKELLASGETLTALLAAAENYKGELDDVLTRIVQANNLVALEEAFRRFEELDLGSMPEYAKARDVLRSDIAAMRDIADYQDKRLVDIEDGKERSGFFTDLKFLADYGKRRAEAKKQLGEALDSLQKNSNKQRMLAIRLKHNGGFLDIYLLAKEKIKYTPPGSSGDGARNVHHIYEFDRSDGVPVRILDPWRYCHLYMNDVNYGRCQVIYPEKFQELRSSRARHQVLIEKLFNGLPAVKEEKLLRSGVEYIKEICRDRTCAPYWKMQLTLRILQAIAPLDLTPEKTLPKMLESVEAIKALDDGSGDPLYNKFLAEKVNVFLGSYDFGGLDRAVAANDLLHDLRVRNSKRNYSCLGVRMNINGVKRFSQSAQLRKPSGDVWCFDGSARGCLIVGRIDRNGVFIADKYQDLVDGRLLFVTSAGENMTDELKALENNPCGVEVKNIVWPDFWPANLRGGDK